MINELDPIAAKQLRDCAVAVYQKKLAISEMFSTEFKFATGCIKHWFRKKYKRRFS